MNKSDLKLIMFIIIIFSFLLILVNLMKNNNPKEALVYYQNKLILTIDLSSKEEKEYKVTAKNGEVVIKSEYNKVKVLSENSPLHLCSNQGYISNSYESIICLPNELVIKINDITDVDTVIK